MGPFLFFATLVTIASISNSCPVVDISSKRLVEINQTYFHHCQPGNLRAINASYNEITTIANGTFDSFYALQDLDLARNNLSSLSTELSVAFSLKYLNMSYNQIQRLESGLKLQRLIELNLSHNQIHFIALDFFEQLQSLKIVDLSHNEMEYFEPWPFRMTEYPFSGINLFDLSYNHIYNTTNNMNWTQKPPSEPTFLVNMTYNWFTVWNDWFMQQYFPQTSDDHLVADLSWTSTDLRFNSWSCDCHLHLLTKKLHDSFFRHARTDLLQWICDGPTEPFNLTGKKVFYDIQLNQLVCNITDASFKCPRGCYCEDRPEVEEISVNCSGAGFTEMPAELPYSKYGRISLDLDHNHISVLNRKNYTKYIVELSMKNNRLESISPDAMRDMASPPEVPKMDFTNNKLKSVPKEIQVFPFETTKIMGNPLECDCDMIWMKDWVNLAGKFADDRGITCKFHEDTHKIIDISESLLNCTYDVAIGISIALGIVLLVTVGLIITAKRCPYETKVVIYRFFRIHPQDKYKVDDDEQPKEYDLYVSFNEKDIHVAQWVKRVLVRQLEEKKPFYKLFVPFRNLPAGPEADNRVDFLEKSKRMLIILTKGYTRNEWCQYDFNQAETTENNDGRIFFVLYDQNAVELSKQEPWESRMKGRKVFSPDEKMFWWKMRYEMPLTPIRR